MATQRIDETDTEFKLRRRLEDQRRRESGPVAPKPTPATPLAQGHWFGPELVCENGDCRHEFFSTRRPCVSEVNQPVLRRAQG